MHFHSEHEVCLEICPQRNRPGELPSKNDSTNCTKDETKNFVIARYVGTLKHAGEFSSFRCTKDTSALSS
ncbi:hypothetical protein RRG08_039438 [Elysia crispata]|uniref:Uncharacterized protein n=1 Tax=Elysia crispata TaxID=231223 RepID=A0AAE1AD17_9GAST|nr:hypothetical protein RRG08_039438 [Elysia crispata]